MILLKELEYKLNLIVRKQLVVELSAGAVKAHGKQKVLGEKFFILSQKIKFDKPCFSII